MNQFNILKLFTLIALVALPATSFASFRTCGTIQQQRGGALTISSESGVGETISPIYGKTPAIDQQLAQLVGFRRVCVEAQSDEGDVVVLSILSRDE